MRNSSMRRAAVAISLALVLVLAAAAAASAASGWHSAGSMGSARGAHVAVRLHDGSVLAIGGFAAGEVAAVDRFDPATGAWSAVESLALGRHYGTATVLRDGRVLVAGGFTAAGVTTECELYDPATGRWSVTGSLNVRRNGHSATLLNDGRVLVAGGSDTGRVTAASAELYDPVTGTWSLTANEMAVPRENAQAALLPDGRVLVAGGNQQSGNLTFWQSADLYDPATNSWSATGAMALPHAQGAVATLLDGGVIVAGGIWRNGHLSAIERYDPASGTWSDAGSIANVGNVLMASSLEDGRVLLTTDGSATTELYDPAARSTTGGYALPQRLSSPAMTALADGRVLVTGGTAGGVRLAAAELFTPPTGRAATATGFGAVTVGERAEREVRVENAGRNRLWIDRTAIAGEHAGDFAIVADGCAGAAVPPGGSCTVKVRFAPSAAGARTARLTFDDNAEDSPAAVLEGTGTARPDRPADPGPKPRPSRPGRAIERFALAPNCVRPSRTGVVRVRLRMRLARLAPVRVEVARAVGTRGMRTCPSGPQRFRGKLRAVSGPGEVRPVAAAAAVDAARTLRLRLTPGLYRITIRTQIARGRLSAPAHRWLRVLLPR